MSAISHVPYNQAQREILMKSTVLKDYPRFRVLGALRTFCEEGGKVYWNARDCAFKFLMIGTQLVIAPIDDHVALFTVFTTLDLSLDEAKLEAQAIEKAPRSSSVIGAGKIGIDGKVSGWKSDGFCIETPHHLREEIEQEIAKLFQNGELTIL